MSSSYLDAESEKSVEGEPSSLYSSEMVSKIRDACGQFEECWKRGERPTIEDHLGGIDPEERPIVFSWLLRVELEMERAGGKSPRAADYLHRFHDYAPLVAEVFAEEAAGDDDDMTQSWSSRLNRQKKLTRPLPKIGEMVDRFEIRGLLGEGGFGTVFRAYDPQLERDVALKIPRFFYWRTSKEREHLLEEARAAALLTHPNVCPIYEVGEERGRPYIVMAWIDGQPLSDLIEAGAVWEQNASILLIRQVALTMDEAHRSGAVHRDLKPANILIDNRGNPILTDFGLAQRTRPGEKGDASDTMRVGTPYYMSPEQVRGELVGPSSDIFSLGVIFYELLTGRRPFVGIKDSVLQQILDTRPQPPSVDRPEIDSHAESVCLTALEKRPADRFASMREMAEALGEVLKSADPVELLSHVDRAPPKLTPPDISHKSVAETVVEKTNGRSRGRALFVCLALLVASGVTGTALFLAGGPRRGETEPLPSLRSPDHDVAQWLASMDAPFDILWKGQTLTVSRPEEIPAGPFHVIRIDLTNRSSLRDEHLLRIQGLEKLQTLLLHDTPLTDDALVHVEDLASLQVLWLDRTQVTDRGLVHLKDLRNLKSLSLNDTVVTGRGLSHLADHPHLSRLSLKRSHADDEGIQGVRNLKSLTNLWLDGTQVTDRGLEALAGLENLVTLMAGELNIEGPGLRHVSSLPKLEQLGLKRTRLHDKGIGELGEFLALTHLFADSTALGDEGFRALVKAAPGLVRLSIGQTNVTNAGLEHLARLPRLETLSLDMLRINQSSLEILASLPRLRSLSIQFARIGDRHVPALSQLTQLENLHLGGSKFSREGRQLLTTALPNCEIH